MLINKESHQREAFTEWPIRLALRLSITFMGSTVKLRSFGVKRSNLYFLLKCISSSIWRILKRIISSRLHSIGPIHCNSYITAIAGMGSKSVYQSCTNPSNSDALEILPNQSHTTNNGFRNKVNKYLLHVLQRVQVLLQYSVVFGVP